MYCRGPWSHVPTDILLDAFQDKFGFIIGVGTVDIHLDIIFTDNYNVFVSCLCFLLTL